MAMEFFRLETDERGITVVTFERPPVNAVSYQVFHELNELVDTIQATDDTRVVIFTGSPRCRAWIGGADLHDFLPLDYEGRLKRFELVDSVLPRFFNLDRPVIAAINNHAVGVGVQIAGLCDIRIASQEAFFSKPEIDRGVVTSAAAFLRLGVPTGKAREIIYTANRFMAEELKDTGFFNYIVPKDQVMPKAMELARVIARKSLPALKALKYCHNAVESLGWQEAYKLTHEYSARLTAGSDSKEGIRAFLEKREPQYKDR